VIGRRDHHGRLTRGKAGGEVRRHGLGELVQLGVDLYGMAAVTRSLQKVNPTRLHPKFSVPVIPGLQPYFVGLLEA
jgi:hypothetical protein